MPQSMLKVYSHLQETLSQVTSSCAVLSKDSQLKKYRFDLQKAISTPINAISGQSGEHLMDKIRRLHRVLSGERVQVTGKTVSASDHPQGKAYCCNLLAQKIVVSRVPFSFLISLLVGLTPFLLQSSPPLFSLSSPFLCLFLLTPFLLDYVLLLPTSVPPFSFFSPSLPPSLLPPSLPPPLFLPPLPPSSPLPSLPPSLPPSLLSLLSFSSPHSETG